MNTFTTIIQTSENKTDTHIERLLKEELPMMKSPEEERPTYFERMSKDSGLIGLSALHRLYPLYGFDVLRDSVFDTMHLLPLNVVKTLTDAFLKAT